MTQAINNANAMQQLKYDQANAANDVKKLNQLKQQADAAPDHKLTGDQAAQVNQALINFQRNQAQIQTDLRGLTESGNAGEVSHAADYMNALNNLAQKATLGLESGNNLDGALDSVGLSSIEIHNQLNQATAANAANLNYANTSGAPADRDNPGAEQQASSDSAINDASADPYAAHTAAPEGVVDISNPAGSDSAPGVGQGAALNVIKNIQDGNSAQAGKDLLSAYSTFLDVTRQPQNDATKLNFANSVQAMVLASPGLSEANKADINKMFTNFNAGYAT